MMRETMQGVSCVVRAGHEGGDAEIDKKFNPQKASSRVDRGGMRGENKMYKISRGEMEGKIYRE